MKRKTPLAVLALIPLMASLLFTSCQQKPAIDPDASTGVEPADPLVEAFASAADIPVDIGSLSTAEQPEEWAYAVDADTLQNEAGSLFLVKKGTGDCVGYRLSETALSNTAAVELPEGRTGVTQDDRRAIAEAFLWRKLDFDNYTAVNDSRDDDSGLTTYRYSRYVQTYPSSDTIFVTIRDDGVITEYAAPNVGQFTGLAVPAISDGYADQCVKEHLEDLYGDSPPAFTVENVVINSSDMGFTLTIRYTAAGEQPVTEELTVPLGESSP